MYLLITLIRLGMQETTKNKQKKIPNQLEGEKTGPIIKNSCADFDLISFC
jgi:hypothetical protein